MPTPWARTSSDFTSSLSGVKRQCSRHGNGLHSPGPRRSTLLSETGAPDDVYEEVARQFGPQEQVALTLAIVAINGWNRLAVGFRQPVGAYVSHLHPISA